MLNINTCIIDNYYFDEFGRDISLFDEMKPTTRKEKIRFAENAARDLKAMGIKHENDIREEMTSLIQEFEDKVTQLKLSLPGDFLKLRINEIHALGDKFPDVVDKWEEQKKENIKKSLKNALKVQIKLPVTPKTPRLKLGKRNSLSRSKKFVVKVEGFETPGGSIKWNYESLKNFELTRTAKKVNFSTGPITRSRRKK